MKKIFVFLFSVCCALLRAQTPADAAVQLSASIQTSPAQITLSWPAAAGSNQYSIFRKAKSATGWGSALATLPGSATQYVDNTVIAGDEYEYRVLRGASGYTGYGYLSAGIEVPEIWNRGKVLLIVDSSFISALAPEIERLVTDMEGDGWEVKRHDVDRNGTVKHVKSLIVADYAIDTGSIKAVFILGHAPVPYSGNINPDGHPDHLGAWPADCYYGDVDGTWTDLSVNSTTNSPARTQNSPGDGKFDQSIIPSDLELQVGRVDFANLSTFALSEQQLLKNYLDKDHAYRKKIFVPLDQAVIDDNFGYFSGETFASSGYKNLSALVGSSNVTAADYFTSMGASSYRWSYGCGGGSYTSASGIGNTSAFATASLQGVFTMLFGSYFGDWDCNNNFLRAALAQGKILTNVWSGRPHYQFHHMGMGENIGYSLIQTQNNPGNLYFQSVVGVTGRWVHNALMGDPTLRNHVVAPIGTVVATKSGYDCIINWSASTETNIAGYNIYVKNDTNTHFVKLNGSPVASTSYTDHCLLYKGVYTYMVRALKLENTTGGSYYNLSEGLSDTAYNSSNIKTVAGFMASVNGNTVQVMNTSQNATGYNWEFGAGQTSTDFEPVMTYSANGTYTILLVTSNGCHSDSSWQVLSITEVGLPEMLSRGEIGFYPSVCTGQLNLFADDDLPLSLEIFDVSGRRVWTKDHLPVHEEIDLSSLPRGVYMVRMRQQARIHIAKLLRD